MEDFHTGDCRQGCCAELGQYLLQDRVEFFRREAFALFYNVSKKLEVPFPLTKKSATFPLGGLNIPMPLWLFFHDLFQSCLEFACFQYRDRKMEFCGADAVLGAEPRAYWRLESWYPTLREADLSGAIRTAAFQSPQNISGSLVAG